MTRYSKLNDYYVQDTVTGDKLSQQDCIKRLNRLYVLKKRYLKRNEAMVEILNEEIDNAESDELKQCLIKVLDRRLDI